MTPILPESTAIRKAIQWVSKMREEGSKVSLPLLIEQACIRFNLPPKDCEFMNRFFKEQETSRPGKD